MPDSPNLVDLLLAAIVLLGAWSGFVRGFAIAALQLLSLALGAALAFTGYPPLARMLEQQVDVPVTWAQPLAFVAIFAVSQLVLAALENRALSALPRGAHQHRLNRALGIAPGFVNGLIHATVAALLLLTVPLNEALIRTTTDSRIANGLSAPAQWLESQLTPIFDPAMRRTMQALTVEPESTELVKLPFTTARATVREDLEARMLDMVNAERAAQGLKPLRADPELAAVARLHSRDMLARGYFSHVSPDQQTMLDRLRAGNVRFIAAGENLALAPTLQRAHQGLMNSPGHRANILRPQFGRVGIGVLDAGLHGLMVTQNFRN